MCIQNVTVFILIKVKEVKITKLDIHARNLKRGSSKVFKYRIFLETLTESDTVNF